jgi:hypothetical protein
MGDHADDLRNQSLLDMTLPGSHDSASFALTRDVMPHSLPWPLDVIVQLAADAGLSVAEYIIHWSLSQHLGIGEQLRSGIRYLDLRAGVPLHPHQRATTEPDAACMRVSLALPPFGEASRHA